MGSSARYRALETHKNRAERDRRGSSNQLLFLSVIRVERNAVRKQLNGISGIAP